MALIFSSTLVIDEISDLFKYNLPTCLVITSISLPSSEMISPMYSPPSFLIIKNKFLELKLSPSANWALIWENSVNVIVNKNRIILFI